MTLDYPALLSLLSQLQHRDLRDRVRAALERFYQELIGAEISALIGAQTHDCTTDRTTYRNGSRPRLLTGPAGVLALRIAKLRQASFFPALFERRRRVDEAPYAVVMGRMFTGCRPEKSMTW